MKKKNGFIATSLIYSFFLVFITLFLGIIASYLQDKVLLNSIEKTTKDTLNTYKGINDLNVGDYFVLSNDLVDYYYGEKNWIIASIKGTTLTLYSYDLYLVDGSYLRKIINYNSGSYETEDSFTCSSPCFQLSYNDFSKDIDSAYMNATYINKIIYSFNTISNKLKSYNLSNYEANFEVNCSGNICGSCDNNNMFSIAPEGRNYTNCISNNNAHSNIKRIRYVLDMSDKKIENIDGEYKII